MPEVKLPSSASFICFFRNLKMFNESHPLSSDLPLEETESNAFMMMDAVGKFAVGVAVVMSVVDAVMSVIDIVDIVEQTKKMVNKLNDDIKPDYKEFFNGIKDSAKAYNAAISEEVEGTAGSGN